jgi:hypothetical protein
MKKFKGMKPLDQLIEDAKRNGWEVDTADYDQKGSDFIYLRDMYERLKQVAVNTVNGHFYVYEPFSDKPTATHLSKELDNEAWYQEILELLYIPLSK